MCVCVYCVNLWFFHTYIYSIIIMMIHNNNYTQCIITGHTIPTVRGELNDEIIERHFLYAAVWAFGGHLSPSHQILFDYWLRSKCRKLLDEELPIPEAGNVSNLLCICACVSVCVNVLCKWSNLTRKSVYTL